MGLARSVSVRLDANVSGYIAKMNSAGAATSAAMGRADKSVVGHSKGLALLGKSAAVGGLAVATGLGYAVKTAADFDASMSKVEAATGRGGAGLKALRDAAIQAGSDTAFSASEAAGGIENLAKAGVSSQNILGGGLRGALDLAAAGELGVADAAEIAATALTQFKLKGADIPHVADLLAAGAGKAQGEVSDLAAALSQAGLVAAGSGLSIEETTGTLAAFASAGLTGSDAGTSFKTMLQRLQAPIGAGAKEMERLNVSAYDTQGNFIGMAGVADQLRDRLKGMTSEQRDASLATIFGSDAVRAARVLYEQGGRGIRKWTAAVDDQGFAADTAKTKLNNLKGDVEQLGGSFETAMIKLGSGAQSPLRGVVQDITSEINKLSKDGTLDRWGENAATAISGVIDVAKDLGPVVGSALSTVGSGVKTVVEGFSALPDGVQKALVTGAVVAAGAKKLGATSLIGAAAKTVGGGGLGGKGGVTPVFVTNMGAAGLGGAAGGAPGGGKAGKAAAIGRGVSKGLGVAAVLTVGGAIMGQAATKSLAASVASGVATGASAGFLVAGPAGAAAGAAVGGLVGAAVHQNPKNPSTAYQDAITPKNAKNVQLLAQSYSVLQKEQSRLTKGASRERLARLLDIPGPVRENADKMAVLQRKIGEATGLTTREVKEQAASLASGSAPITKAASNFNTFAANAKYAGVSTRELTVGLSTLPTQVQTKILTPGAVESKADVSALGKQYGLTPTQVKTIMQLVGAEKAGEKTKRTREQLAAFNNTKYKPKIDVQDNASSKVKSARQVAMFFAKDYQSTLKANDAASPKAEAARKRAQAFAKAYLAALKANDAASGKIANAVRLVNSFNGRTATSNIYVITHRVERISRQIVGAAASLFGGRPSADGSFYEGGVQAFAGGGTTEGGAYVPRTPQIRSGRGRGVLWGEEETGWEAYISGKPGQADRNRDIWRMAGERLGVRFEEFADGGLTAYANGGGRRRSRPPGLDISGDESNREIHRDIRAYAKALDRYAKKHPNFNDLTAKQLRRLEVGIRRVVDRYQKQEKELEKAREGFKALREAARSYKQGVREAYVDDPFQSTLGGFRNQTDRETKNLEGTKADLRTLSKNGLDGELYKQLAASGNSALIDQFSKLSRGEIEAEERRFKRRNALAGQLAAQATTKVYAKDLRDAASEVRDLKYGMRELRQELALLRKGRHIGHHIVNFNGRVSARDTEGLAKKLHDKQRVAARLARQR
ncbi:MAG TPA: phage tail tape measure protein [Propionibacteriaceae bacterium]|jgi:TP901 family phage tail tape measure protein